MAIVKEIQFFSSKSILIECRAIPIGSALTSCHFIMPNGQAFSINEKVTERQAIDGIYYFNSNKKLSDGFCTVIIKQLNKIDHGGKWLCGGRLLGHNQESYDTINVTVDVLRGASFSYLSMMIMLPVIFVLGSSAFVYNKWKQRQQRIHDATLDEISMHTVSSSNTEITTSSEQSGQSGYSA